VNQNKNLNNLNNYYDLREDWHLIEASFAKQYGIRLRKEGDMPFAEFASLLSGLMPDTPLGQVVAIRAEKDPEVIKNFTYEQKKIYNEWQKKKALQMQKEDYEEQMKNISLILKSLFGKDNKQ